MADNDNTGIYRVLRPVLLAYPSVITPRAFGPKNKPKGDPKYGGTFVFAPDHPDLKPIKDLIVKVARAMFPGGSLKEMSFPISNGDDLIERQVAALVRQGKSATEQAAIREKFSWAKGKALLKASSKFQPALAVVNAGEIVNLDTEVLKTTNKGAFYFGVQALPEFNFIAGARTSADSKDYVTAYLNGLVSINTGDKIGGGGSLAERFSGYVGTAKDYDPTAGATTDDDIPF